MKIKKTLRYSEKTISQLENICNRTGMTSTAAIENAVEKYLEAIEKKEIDIREIKIK